MSEWFKVHPWKGCVGATLPGVRIPLFPLCQMLRNTAFKTPPEEESSNGMRVRCVPELIWLFLFTVHECDLREAGGCR